MVYGRPSFSLWGRLSGMHGRWSALRERLGRSRSRRKTFCGLRAFIHYCWKTFHRLRARVSRRRRSFYGLRAFIHHRRKIFCGLRSFIHRHRKTFHRLRACVSRRRKIFCGLRELGRCRRRFRWELPTVGRCCWKTLGRLGRADSSSLTLFRELPAHFRSR